MIFYLLVLILLSAGIFWIWQVVLDNPGLTTITWGIWSLEMKTATLVAGVILVCVLLYFGLSVLQHLFGLRKRLNGLRESRRYSKANRALTQGLIQLTEGHWEKAEKLLSEHAAHSETPLLNYLAAARAAQMQEAYQRRDEFLRQAIESDSKAAIAVGVSQAEMQLASGQLEQAHATLTHLRDIAPKHPYVLKLMAKVLYQQKSWEALLDLLPELIKQNLLKTDNMHKVQGATLQATFQRYAQEKKVDKLQALWRKLPGSIRENPEAVLLYASALRTAGDELGSANLLSSHLSKTWDDQLANLYGRIRHHSLGSTIQQAEKWQATQPNNPALLLLLARLYNQQKLWGMAKSYYEASLTQAPLAEAYLELAELLETMREPENAQRCYRLGLRYSIRKEGEKLNLQPPVRASANAELRPVAIPTTPYQGQ